MKILTGIKNKWKKCKLVKLENTWTNIILIKRVNILNNQIKGEKVIIKELIPNVYKLSSE